MNLACQNDPFGHDNDHAAISARRLGYSEFDFKIKNGQNINHERQFVSRDKMTETSALHTVGASLCHEWVLSSAMPFLQTHLSSTRIYRIQSVFLSQVTMSFVAPLKDSESLGGLVFFVLDKNSSALDLLALWKICMWVK